jgi:hypothetical protein
MGGDGNGRTAHPRFVHFTGASNGRCRATNNPCHYHHRPCTLRRACHPGPRPARQPKTGAHRLQHSHHRSRLQRHLQIWKIQFSGISSIDNAAVRYLNGSIIIDGSTQPGGRTSGPKIILVGPGTGQWDGLKLGETATQNSNEIRGLGFQKFKTHIYVNSSSNIIENNWFG